MKNNKIGLLVMVMILGVSNFQSSPVLAQDIVEDYSQSVISENQSDLKANKETLDKAKNAMDNKDYQSAIVYLSMYIQAKPKKYEPYKMRGECFYALHQFKLAERDFQTAIDLKSADDKFMTGAKVVSAVVLGADKQEQYQNTELGNLYGELMYAQKAQNNPAYEETYKKAFEYNSHIYLPKPKKEDIQKINCPQKYGKILNPQGIDADIMAIIDDIEKEQYHEAAYKLPQITLTYPKYYYGHYLTGVVMAGLEQDRDAISAFETALKYNPYDFESMASLGQIYYSESEKKFSQTEALKSIEYFKKALTYNPNCSMYNYYIGLNNLLIGNNTQAVASFNSAIADKPNDYNSMYYKAIAQQMNGDYSSVIEGTTQLLAKRVSNSNSVLYLRALAYFKSGNNELALADIDKVFEAMNDVYNADIKTLSRKEQTLDKYLYYLKAQIEKTSGQNASIDYGKAFENPIIKALASGQNYDLKLTTSDIENQYDYIRTTFDKIGNVYYTGYDYRLTSQDIFPNKLYSDAVSQDLTSPSLAQLLAMPNFSIPNKATPVIEAPKENVAYDNMGHADNSSSTLRKSSEPEETLAQNGLSIAQMLATNSIPSVAVENSEHKPEDSLVTTLPIDITKDEIKVPVQTAKKGESFVFTAQDVSKDIMSEQLNKVETKTAGIVEVEQTSTPVNIATVVSAPIQKESETFNISYENQPETITVAEVENPVQDIAEASKEIASEVVASADATKVISTVANKPDDVVDFKISYENQPETITVAEVENTVQDIAEASKEIASEVVVSADATKIISTVASKPDDVVDFKISYENQPETITVVEVENTVQDIVEPIKDTTSDVASVTEIATPNVSEIEVIVDATSQSVISVAKEIKETPAFTISYNKEPQQLLENTVSVAEEKLEQSIAQVQEEIMKEKPEAFVQVEKITKLENTLATNTITPENVQKDLTDMVKSHFGETADISSTKDAVSNVVKIDENGVTQKFANVDLSEFNIQKSMPEISEDDEIIALEPVTSFIAQVGQRLNSQNYTMTNPTANITDNFSQYHQNISEENQTPVQEVIASAEDKSLDNLVSDANDSDLNIANNTKKDKIKSVVPKVRTGETNIASEEVVSSTSAQKKDKVEEAPVSESVVAENPEDDQWLKDFLSKAEEVKPKTAKASKKNRKTENSETLKDFLSDEYTQSIALAEKTKQKVKNVVDEEKKSELKAQKKAQKEQERKEKAEQRVAQAEQRAKMAEESAIRRAELKAERTARKVEQKALRDAEDIKYQAEKEAQKEALRLKKAEQSAQKIAIEAQDKAVKEAKKMEKAAKKVEAKAQKEAEKLQKAANVEKTSIIEKFKTHRQELKDAKVKAKKDVTTVVTSEKEAIAKKKKEFQWWWNREKSEKEQVVKEKKQKLEKTDKEKKNFSIKNLFSQKSTVVEEEEVSTPRKWLIRGYTTE